jgi:hypothetical protein
MYPGALIQNDFYFSWWVYIPSSLGNPTADQWLILFQIEGSIQPLWTPIFSLIQQYGTTPIKLGGRDNNGEDMGILANPHVAIPRDQWVHLEWYTHIGTNGTLAAWMDGAKLWEVNGVDTSGLKTSTLCYMVDLYGMNGSFYADDFALYNVNMNGTA